MKMTRIRRLAALRKGVQLAIHQQGRAVCRDYAMDELSLPGGEMMFKRMKIGMIVVIDTFGFPYVGRVVEFDDLSITIEDGVKIIFDGRHNKYAAGSQKVPGNAEIENTHSPYTIPIDVILGWAPYAGGVIPKQQ